MSTTEVFHEHIDVLNDAPEHIERLGVVVHRDTAQDALGAADDVVGRDQHVRAAAQPLLDQMVLEESE